MKRKTGYDAIEFADDNGLTLSKYQDPTEEARDGLSVEEAEQIAGEDPSLIYLDVGTTARNITNAQIRDLLEEAVGAGDYRMADICDVALAAHETSDSQGGELRGPDGHYMTRAEARAECARVIADAEAHG